jgi:hypothetical protein
MPLLPAVAATKLFPFSWMMACDRGITAPSTLADCGEFPSTARSAMRVWLLERCGEIVWRARSCGLQKPSLVGIVRVLMLEDLVPIASGLRLTLDSLLKAAKDILGEQYEALASCILSPAGNIAAWPAALAVSAVRFDRAEAGEVDLESGVDRCDVS